jgi:hypothetical protein
MVVWVQGNDASNKPTGVDQAAAGSPYMDAFVRSRIKYRSIAHSVQKKRKPKMPKLDGKSRVRSVPILPTPLVNSPSRGQISASEKKRARKRARLLLRCPNRSHAGSSALL